MGKLTVNIPEDIHQKVRDAVAADESLTTSILIQKAIEIYYQRKDGKTMNDNTRTLAFQVSEELFERLKAYLAAHNLKQKQFVVSLIEQALEEWENGQQPDENN